MFITPFIILFAFVGWIFSLMYKTVKADETTKRLFSEISETLYYTQKYKFTYKRKDYSKDYKFEFVSDTKRIYYYAYSDWMVVLKGIETHIAKIPVFGFLYVLFKLFTFPKIYRGSLRNSIIREITKYYPKDQYATEESFFNYLGSMIANRKGNKLNVDATMFGIYKSFDDYVNHTRHHKQAQNSWNDFTKQYGVPPDEYIKNSFKQSINDTTHPQYHRYTKLVENYRKRKEDIKKYKESEKFSDECVALKHECNAVATKVLEMQKKYGFK